jgi:L-serine dehydratase
MKKKYPSIFNDVIGPVMRGPSSSHCAGSLRIGRMLRNLMDDLIQEVLIEYDPNGSLVTTHASQGTDMGLYSGFLGYDTCDERILNYKEEIKKAGIKIKVNHISYGAKHPNTYRITLKNKQLTHQVTALSLGGGMIEFVEIDGATVSMQGDLWETLVFVSADCEHLVGEFAAWVEAEEISLKNCRQPFIHISTIKPITVQSLNKIKRHRSVTHLSVLKPVLPIISRRNIKVPFLNCDEMIRFNKNRNLQLWELAVAYEMARGNISAAEVFEKMALIVRIMADSIDNGLRGTEFADRILPAQSLLFKEKMAGEKLLDDPVLNRIILYVSAIMEMKSSMGVIVAAPTAGACGTLPGAVIGAGRVMNIQDEEIVKSMLAAGLIGVFIADQSTFAAENAGCQAECGSASGMAAAGLVQLAGGNLEQALGAASLALQNSFGMTCDPIANRVEAPCLGKNVMAAANALACANMALAGYQHLIPLDEVLQAFDKVGRSLPRELRCTALGGLSVTKTAQKIQDSLLQK